MRLLFDQNLSHRLIDLLSDIFEDSTHVRRLGLHEADDLTVWSYAKNEGYVIVSQDSDYAEWHKIRGAPPKIIWIRCGNASVDQIHMKLRNAADRILLMDHDVVEIDIVEIW
jgi:predicted nuclease of predicted toxin-antitoxin system